MIKETSTALPTYGLSKLVSAHYGLRPGVYRSTRIHPSQVFYDCPVLHWFREVARERLGSDNTADITAGFKFLQDDAHDREAAFSPGVKREFNIGTAINDDVQYQLGLVGKLWGRWECPSCRLVTEEGDMPKMLVHSACGVDQLYPAPCVRCRSNLRHTHPWKYIEPWIPYNEWGIRGRYDGDLRILVNGEIKRFVLEIKSAHENKWEEKSNGPLPIMEHHGQASVYAWLTKIDLIYFIYVCKNQTSRWKEIVVAPKPELIEFVQNFIQAVRWGHEHGQPPLYARVCPDIMDRRAVQCRACEQCFGQARPTNYLSAAS